MSNLTGYQTYRFPDGVQAGDEWRTACPAEGCEHEDPKFFLNLETGASHCHHCGFSTSSWVGLIAKVENLHGREEIGKWIRDHRDELDGHKIITSRSYHVREAMARALPAACQPVVLGGPFHDYLGRRGFTVRHIREHGIMECREGYYRNRVIIPIREDGELVFFFDRSVDPTEKMKTLGIGSKSLYWPIDKREVLFNLDAVRSGEPLLVAEGVMDAMSLSIMSGLPAIALLGKSCSHDQMLKIEKRNPGEIHVCLDDDAVKHAVDLAGRFSRAGFNARVRHFSQGDPNDYLVKGIQLPPAVPYQKFNIMLKMQRIGGLARVG